MSDRKDIERGSDGESNPLFSQFLDMTKSFGGPLVDNKFSAAWQRYLKALAASPDAFHELTAQHAKDHSELLGSLTDKDDKGDDGKNGKENDKGSEVKKGRPDPRFSHHAWQENPFYRYLKDSYLLNSKLMRDMAGKVDLEEEDRQAVNFILEQVISALAPSNFPTTNPEVIDATIETKGDNLRRGMENYVSDLRTGAITQSDPDAFSVGENLAVTPGKVVAQNRLMQLIEYAPTTAKVNARPVLIVPPCINKYYILDLSQNNSFVRHLVDSGQRVFLISWVNAGETHAKASWDDYVSGGVLEAISIAREICGGKEPVHTLGYCIGGTLLATALSVMRAHGNMQAASISLLTTMLDHCDTGDVGLFVEESFVKEQESKYANGGIFDGLNLRRTFAYMRPKDLVWPYVVRNYMLGETPGAFDILYWNADSTNLPGRFYAWYLRHNYVDNDLKDKGVVESCGTKVDYRKIGLPGMVIATERDHIVPWHAAYSSARLLGKRVDFVLASSGHVAGIVNPPGKQKGYHMTAPRAGVLPADWQKWRDKAVNQDGTWWTRYFAWLDKNSGGKVDAPKEQGSYRYLAIEDAPGSYVTAPLPDASAIRSDNKE